MEQENSDMIMVTVSGANRVDVVRNLRKVADNLDGAPAEPESRASRAARPPTTKGKALVTAQADDSDDDDFSPQANTTTGFDDDEGTPEEATGFGDEEAPEPSKKKTAKAATPAKKKKITIDDVNDACKAHAIATGSRKETLGILQRKFKTQSVTALKPEQYEACIAAMKITE